MTSVEVVVLLVLVGWIDIVRQKDRVFLCNLGVSTIQVCWLFALPALIGEVLVALVGRVFA